MAASGTVSFSGYSYLRSRNSATRPILIPSRNGSNGTIHFRKTTTLSDEKSLRQNRAERLIYASCQRKALRGDVSRCESH